MVNCPMADVRQRWVGPVRPLAAALAAGVSVVALLALPADPVGAAGAAAAQPDRPAGPTVVVAAVTDSNGDAPGGVSVTRLPVAEGDADRVADELERLPEVVIAERDQRIAIAADPLASRQYGTSRIRANGIARPDDGAGRTVAVLDTGVDGSHPDLAAPLPGGGRRVLTGTTFLAPGGPGEPNLTGAPGNVDPDGHGTHVAGIISAARGNGIGIEGIAPAAAILPVRVLDRNGAGWASDIAAGILWADQAGADVINLSLAGSSPAPAIESAVNQVGASVSGPLLVAAAGNVGPIGPPQWPAAYPGVLAVGATDSRDRVAPFSNTQSYLDLAAPGVGIWSTCPGGYCSRSGTSMAGPYVAAAAAVLWAREPGLSTAAVQARLEQSARDLRAAGRDDETGHGRLDLATAVDPARFPRQARPTYLPTGQILRVEADGRRITVAARAADVDGRPRVRIESTVDGRRSVRVWSPNRSDGVVAQWDDLPGEHRICVTALDVPTGRWVGLGCRDLVVK